jgi:flagellar motor switch protein FliN/FliY
MTATSDRPTAEVVPGPPAEVQPEALPVGVLYDVSLQLTVELGRTSLPIKEVLRLGPGSVIDLGKSVGEPVEILANGKLIARGELVVVESALAVRILEIARASDSNGG